jgi:hypothetical protein
MNEPKDPEAAETVQTTCDQEVEPAAICSPFRETLTWYKASEIIPKDGEEVLVQLAENGAIEENLFRDGSFHWWDRPGRWVSDDRDGDVGWWARVTGPYPYIED